MRLLARDVRAMLEYVLLLLGLIRAATHGHARLVSENPVVRQQLAILTRPTRQRPRLRPCGAPKSVSSQATRS